MKKQTQSIANEKQMCGRENQRQKWEYTVDAVRNIYVICVPQSNTYLLNKYFLQIINEDTESHANRSSHQVNALWSIIVFRISMIYTVTACGIWKAEEGGGLEQISDPIFRRQFDLWTIIIYYH